MSEEYIIVQAPKLEELPRLVNEKLKLGYEALGSVSGVMKTQTEYVYVQAMIGNFNNGE